MEKIKAIITGTTGMVGEGVLHECLQHPDVESVLIINRRPLGIMHPKLREIIHHDFLDFTPIATQLFGYNACYFCLGISSVGVKKAAYFEKTYTLTTHIAGILAERNPEMTFCYVSGAGTDSNEKGNGWSAVKGKTENALFKMHFKNFFAFRPGFIKPIPGLRNTHKLYSFINWVFPIGRKLFPGGFCTLHELGQAMINVTLRNLPSQVVEGKDIIRLAKPDQKV